MSVVMHFFVQFFSYDPEILHVCSPPYAASLINFWWRAGANVWARRRAHAFSVVMHFFVQFSSYDSEIGHECSPPYAALLITFW